MAKDLTRWRRDGAARHERRCDDARVFSRQGPGHVENFVKLAEKGFYDGTVFHA